MQAVESRVFFIDFVTSLHTTNLCQHEWQISEGKNAHVRAMKAEDILTKLSVVAIMRGLSFQDTVNPISKEMLQTILLISYSVSQSI